MEGKNNSMSNNVLPDDNYMNLSNILNKVRNAIPSNGLIASKDTSQGPVLPAHNVQQKNWIESNEYGQQWDQDKSKLVSVVPHLNSSFVSDNSTAAPVIPDTSKPPPCIPLTVADTSQPPPTVMFNQPAVNITDVSKPPPVVDVTKPPPDMTSEPKKDETSEAETQWNLLNEYWTFVQENPYDFDGWSRLLNHVETTGEIATARSAFEGFLPLFPYCFAYWRKFAEMEKKYTDVQMSLGILLYGVRAIPLCQELWIPLLKYFIKYAKDTMISDEVIRGIYSMGLTRVGFSWYSAPFWELCIGYEMEKGNLQTVFNIYVTIIQLPNKVYNKHWDKLIALVRDSPLASLLTTKQFEDLRMICLGELKDKSLLDPKYETQLNEKLSLTMKEKLVASLIKIHEQTIISYEKRWKFEEKIKRPYFHVKPLDRKQLKIWNEYLDYEIKEGDPVRIIILFERCLISCAQYEELWCRYAMYMEEHIVNVCKGKYSDVKYKPTSFSKDSDATDDLFSFAPSEFMNFNVPTQIQTQVDELVTKLSEGVGVGQRVLLCPSLDPEWILRGITQEDLRQLYRRSAWIHCPNKPKIFMQWAEFEEAQGDAQVARELLNTVLAKHPLLLKARLQLIELERRSGNLDLVEQYYCQALGLFKEPACRSLIAIRYARFLFKVRGQKDQPLIVLRKALKKDKGNIHLFHHVFDMCYQRFPVDTNGVLASVVLALSSKELTLEQKYELCLKRREFLKEHGTITQIQDAKVEMLQIERLLESRKTEENKLKKDEKKQQEKEKQKLKEEEEKQLRILKEREEVLRLELEKVVEQERKSEKSPKYKEALEEGEEEDDGDEDEIYWSKRSRNSDGSRRRKDPERRGHKRRRRDKSPRHSRRSKRSSFDENPELDGRRRRPSDDRINGNIGPLSDIGNFQAPPIRHGALNDSSFNTNKGSNVGVLQIDNQSGPPLVPNFNEAPPPILNFPVRPPAQPFRPTLVPPGPLDLPRLLPPRLDNPMRLPPPQTTRPDFQPGFQGAKPMPLPIGMNDIPGKIIPFQRPTQPPPRFDQQMRNPLLAFNTPTIPLPNFGFNQPRLNLPSNPPTQSIINVPDWLINEGGELKLSEGINGPSVIRYWPKFLTENGHDVLLDSLRKIIKWFPQKVQVKPGTWVDDMVASWLGPCGYKKNSINLAANNHWPPEMLDLLHMLVQACNMDSPFNSCLLRLLRHGMDNLTWDSEQHPAMNKNPTVAFITVGAPRTIEMRHRNGPEFIKFPLLSGSLLVTEGSAQSDWVYQIPKDLNTQGETISLSFRTMLMIQGLTV